MNRIVTLFLALGLITLVSCGEKNNSTTQKTDPIEMHNQMNMGMMGQNFQYGDIVPNDLVCMVNDAFMGREQLEVEFEGKTYYGCCQMCQERIPTEETARVAIDPVTKQKVDKSLAVIAITGDKGEVTYFENKESYQKFMEALN